MANSTKRVQADASFGFPFILVHIVCTTSVTQFTLCKQFPKFMHLPNNPDLPVRYSGSEAGNQQWIAREIPADDSWYLCSNTNEVAI